jgi:bifunctional DNA primase/polymerase-like protein
MPDEWVHFTPDQVRPASGLVTACDSHSLPRASDTAEIAAALAAAERGWRVFPVQAGGKAPRDGWRWAEWHTTYPARIRGWWASGGNTGIATGPSGLVVIDLDVGDGRPLPAPWDTVPGVNDGGDVYAVLAEGHGDGWPETYTVMTPRGGWHFYFQAGGHSIRNSASQVGPLIDVRGDGGFVVAAGSVRPEAAYELIDDRDPAPLPSWLAQLAARAKSEPPRRVAAPPADRSRAYVRAALEAEVRAVAAAPGGQRNDQLNRSAYALARFVAVGELTAEMLTAALTEAARHAGLGPAETQRTIASALKGRCA